MNVKGFILEDEQGREFVMLCGKAQAQSARTFALRGWQRRRLVPLQYPEWDLRQIVAGVLISLDEFFKSLPRFSGNIQNICSIESSTMSPLLRKTPVLRKVSRVGQVL